MARGTLERAGAYTGSDFRVPVASRGCTSVFTRSRNEPQILVSPEQAANWHGWHNFVGSTLI